ncbi:dihydrolipoyl dehydrogenase [Actinomadura sp. 6N118]|uniref:dihydrolipoyl dehydrogenase n=1 Tax=Actinomadura sp. 6N118 TaxID=3375151 RepID=UPI00379FC585
MANSGPFDIVVLGGGSGGYACALRAAELGKSVALIERDKLGGTCLNRGCIPTKALLHAAEVADQTREAATFGIKASFEGIDVAGVNAYKDKIVSTTVKGLAGLIKSKGITVVEGDGRLTGPATVEVTGSGGESTTLEGRHIVLATGSVPKSLPGLDIDGERVISSDHALVLEHVPASVVVLGGGVIGVEFASVWRSFGAEVTIVEALPHLLPLEEESSSKRLERAFRKRGIKYELGVKFQGVKPTPGGVSVTLDNGKTIDAELLLVAVGRGPVSEGIGLEEVGVQTERGFVKVDEFCQTSVSTISAVGDLIPTPQLAHVGFAEGILVAERLGGLNPPAIDYDGVPRITYSDPEVAAVGITTKVAAERGYEIKQVTYDLAGNPKSKILGTQGEVKVIAAVDGPVLGIHMVGARVGELITEGQLIYNWEALPAEVAQLIHPHPTQSEAVGEAHLALAGKPLHVHG